METTSENTNIPEDKPDDGREEGPASEDDRTDKGPERDTVSGEVANPFKTWRNSEEQLLTAEDIQ